MFNKHGEVETRVGVGLADVLLVVFIVLKLVGVINWSWWWVLSPLWISILLVLIIAAWVIILNKN